MMYMPNGPSPILLPRIVKGYLGSFKTLPIACSCDLCTSLGSSILSGLPMSDSEPTAGG